MIVVVDYEMGNIGSIMNMLKKVGVDASLSYESAAIEKADGLILPGVGSFDKGMQNLDEGGLKPLLDEMVIEKKKPILGICLGMQLLTKNSEEGKLPGFGWIQAKTVKFNHKKGVDNLRVPHMGWNTIKIKRQHRILEDFYEDSRFYFVHSYYVECSDDADILSTTTYGVEFTSCVNKENVYGVQFHPEKSHKFGMKFLKNFARIL
jgi:glutamine amidotransferase